ncbi:MAG: hypothetical protein QUV05_02225 [Phycisphaerae bacterium]|nr:hypothetical protein [Phycisphaerae bacterium]
MSPTQVQKVITRCSGEYLLLLRIVTGSRFRQQIDEELDRRAGVRVRHAHQVARVRRAA